MLRPLVERLLCLWTGREPPDYKMPIGVVMKCAIRYLRKRLLYNLTSHFIRPIQKMQQNPFISANAFVQHAGIAALTRAQPEVEEMIRLYDERRRYLFLSLKELGFSISVEPRGPSTSWPGLGGSREILTPSPWSSWKRRA